MTHPHRKNHPRKTAPTRFVPEDAASAHGKRLDPLAGKKTGGSYIGALIVAAGGILFVAYIFNYQGVQTTLDALFNDLYRTSQTHTGEVQTGFDAVLPIFGYVLAAVIGLVAIRSLFRGAATSIHGFKLSRRPEVSLHDFCAEAQKHDISIKVAREAYKLLQPICRDTMRARMSDTLGGDLRLSGTQQEDLYANLLTMSDRKSDPLAEPKMETVLELLTVVQNSQRRSVTDVSTKPIMVVATAVVHPPKLPVPEKQCGDVRLKWHGEAARSGIGWGCSQRLNDKLSEASVPHLHDRDSRSRR